MISRILRGSATIVFAAAVFSSATTAGSGAEAVRLAQVTTTPKGDLLNQTPAEQKDAWTVSCRKT
ncbi:MAG: hypothetical protein ACR2PM_15570, partial [Hyphomicrobiales bacterium]